MDILNIGSKIIDKIFPDAGKRQEAKVKLLELQQQGEFKEDELRYDAIIQDSKSSDPWTSRARPAFLYVIYTYILAGIPFAIIGAFYPAETASVASSLKIWFEAIPGELYALFGAGYLGYGAYRSFDKAKGKKT